MQRYLLVVLGALLTTLALFLTIAIYSNALQAPFKTWWMYFLVASPSVALLSFALLKLHGQRPVTDTISTETLDSPH
jgi:hypothetical protein